MRYDIWVSRTVEDDRIIIAPPIVRWTIGKSRRDVLRYYSRQPEVLIEFLWG